MWTRGWDVYSPDEHVVFHLWDRSYRPTFWEVDGYAELRRASQQRVRRLLTATPLAEPNPTPQPDTAQHPDTDPIINGPAAPPPDAPIWGLGDTRSLGAYQSYAGVDFGAKVASAAAERGGRPTEASFWAGPALDGDEGAD